MTTSGEQYFANGVIVNAVPEPASIALFSLGLLGLLALRRKTKHKA